MWTFFLSSSYFTLYNDTVVKQSSSSLTESELDQRILTADFGAIVLGYTIMFALLQGIILAVVRTNEPIYKHLIFEEIKSWFGELINEEDIKNDLKKNSASALMNKQLSQDMIYTILHGITEHTVGRVMDKDWKKYQMYDFMSGKSMTKNEVLIESMVVKNPNSLIVANIDGNYKSLT